MLVPRNDHVCVARDDGTVLGGNIIRPGKPQKTQRADFTMNSGRLIGVRLELRRLSFGRLMEPEEAERAERVLAAARVLFAVAAFVAISIDPTEPTRYSSLAYTLLLTYVLYSLGVLIVLSFLTKRLPPTAPSPP